MLNLSTKYNAPIETGYLSDESNEELMEFGSFENFLKDIKGLIE